MNAGSGKIQVPSRGREIPGSRFGNCARFWDNRGKECISLLHRPNRDHRPSQEARHAQGGGEDGAPCLNDAPRDYMIRRHDGVSLDEVASTSMPAPVASGWSDRRVALHPLENAALSRRTWKPSFVPPSSIGRGVL